MKRDARPPLATLALLLLAGCAPTGVEPSAAQGSAGPTFTDVTQQAGLAAFVQENGRPDKPTILESIGAGVAFVDYDADGWLDVYLTNGSTLEPPDPSGPSGPSGTPRDAMYRNTGGTFQDQTAALGLGDANWTMGVRAVDVEGDGWPALYLTNWGPNVLYRNLGGERFADVTADAGVGDGHWSTGACFVDYDLDGDLDLYVVNYLKFDGAKPPAAVHEYRGVRVYFGPNGLPGEPDTFYRNEGAGKFVDATREVGIGSSHGFGFQAVTLDYDEDGRPDIFVGNDSTPNYLWHNDGNGGFRDRGVEAGVALSNTGMQQAGMGVAVGDCDGDGHLDLFVTNFAEDYNTLYRSHGNEFFADATVTAGLLMCSIQELGWGCGFNDFDSDGDLDLFVTNGHVWPQVDQFEFGTRYRQRNQLLLNSGTGTFRDATDHAGTGFQVLAASRGAAAGDFDNDGDVDLLFGNLDAPPTLLRNDAPAGGHWLLVRAIGAGANRDAVGGRITLRAGGADQVRPVGEGSGFLSSNDPRIHFGVGAARIVDELRIAWPAGSVQSFRNVAVDHLVTVREGSDELEAVLLGPTSILAGIVPDSTPR